MLKYKRQAEELLERSGLPWTIIRPSRLTDGPYTSYDLNTLLKATSGTRQVRRECRMTAPHHKTSTAGPASRCDDQTRIGAAVALWHCVRSSSCTTGASQDVQLSLRDDQVGEASRIAVAGATQHSFFSPLILALAGQ